MIRKRLPGMPAFAKAMHRKKPENLRKIEWPHSAETVRRAEDARTSQLLLSADLLDLIIKLLGQIFADLGGILLNHRLDLIPHAGDLLGRNVVDLHPAFDQSL